MGGGRLLLAAAVVLAAIAGVLLGSWLLGRLGARGGSGEASLPPTSRLVVSGVLAKLIAVPSESGRGLVSWSGCENVTVARSSVTGSVLVSVLGGSTCSLRVEVPRGTSRFEVRTSIEQPANVTITGVVVGELHASVPAGFVGIYYSRAARGLSATGIDTSIVVRSTYAATWLLEARRGSIRVDNATMSTTFSVGLGEGRADLTLRVGRGNGVKLFLGSGEATINLVGVSGAHVVYAKGPSASVRVECKPARGPLVELRVASGSVRVVCVGG